VWQRHSITNTRRSSHQSPSSQPLKGLKGGARWSSDLTLEFTRDSFPKPQTSLIQQTQTRSRPMSLKDKTIFSNWRQPRLGLVSSKLW